MKKKVIVLVITTLLILGVTFLAWPIATISQLWLKRLLSVLINLTNGAIAFIAIKITGIKIDLDIKNYLQYLIGIAIALSLSLGIAFIPALCGASIVGSHQDFSWGLLLWSFFNFFLVIGPVEELIFRVYYQETFIGFLNKNKWIGVLIAAFMFGWWHIINGSLLQVAFTFGIGLVFGMCKYYIKNCKYLGLALGHGLYDFLNVIVRMFIV